MEEIKRLDYRKRISKAKWQPVGCIGAGIRYSNASEAAKELDTTPDMVSKVLHNKSRCKTIHGYHLEFI